MKMTKRVQFTGTVKYQFVGFNQAQMFTDESGTQVFVAIAKGYFGDPPNGTPFETEIRLTLGATLSDDAYQVRVHDALAALGARPEFAATARAYTAKCMSFMFGPDWYQLAGMTAISNAVEGVSSELYTLHFPDGAASW